MIFCRAISKLMWIHAAVALALSVSVSFSVAESTSEGEDARRWLTGGSDDINNVLSYDPLAQHYFQGHQSFRGTGKRVVAKQNEEQEEESLTFENTVCENEILSMFCEVVDAVNSKNDASSRLEIGYTNSNLKFVDFELDFTKNFTLFAPANSVFTKDGERLVLTIPPGLSIAEFLANHIIDDYTYTLENLCKLNDFDLPTRYGETTKTFCPLDGKNKTQRGLGVSNKIVLMSPSVFLQIQIYFN